METVLLLRFGVFGNFWNYQHKLKRNYHNHNQGIERTSPLLPLSELLSTVERLKTQWKGCLIDQWWLNVVYISGPVHFLMCYFHIHWLKNNIRVPYVPPVGHPRYQKTHKSLDTYVVDLQWYMSPLLGLVLYRVPRFFS